MGRERGGMSARALHSADIRQGHGGEEKEMGRA